MSRMDAMPFEIDLKQRMRLTDQLADGFRRAILTGVYREGAALPPLREVCERFGVSMIVARAAYRRLGEEGLTVSRQRIGCIVAPKKPLLIGLSDAFEPAWSTNYWPTISGTCLSYVDAIGKAGHVPIVLCRTYDTNMLEKVMGQIDLLLMTGGGDVDPGRYGEDNRKSFRIMLLKVFYFFLRKLSARLKFVICIRMRIALPLLFHLFLKLRNIALFR